MDLALYDPDGGYYRAEAARPGRDGDFLTAPEAHPIFGAALARAVADAWDRLGRPEPFVLREYGAGTGTLALAILDGLAAEHPDLAARLRYDPIEVEPRRLAAHRRPARGGRPRRRARREPAAAATPIDRRSSSPTRSSTRCRSTGSSSATARLREVLVGSRDGAFVDVEAEPTDARRSPRASPTRRSSSPTGQRAEICLALDPWLADAAAGLERGVLLLIDYGYPAAELYDPVRRRDGTLRAYLRHRVHDDPYIHVGRQDLTAHVDVTRGRTRGGRGRPRPPRHDDPGRVPRRPRHGGPAPGDPGRPGDDPRGRTSPSARRSCGCSTRARWAASGSWPSGAAGRPGRRSPDSATRPADALAPTTAPVRTGPQ